MGGALSARSNGGKQKLSRGADFLRGLRRANNGDRATPRKHWGFETTKGDRNRQKKTKNYILVTIATLRVRKVPS